jgi:hypothetical protein
VEKGFQVLLVFPVEQISDNVLRIMVELNGDPACEIAISTIKRSRPEVQEPLLKYLRESKEPVLRRLSAAAGKST